MEESMPIRYLIVFVVLALVILPTQFSRRATTAAATRGAQTAWFFFVVETHVTQKGVEPDDEHPEERRWYISNITALPENIADYSAKKKSLEYFDANIVAPAATHGIAVDYHDEEAGINGGSVLGRQIARGGRRNAHQRHRRS